MSQRTRRHVTRGYGSDSDEEGHVVSWIPDDDIEVEALAYYLRQFVDKRAKLQPASKPRDERRQGWLITAKSSLSYDQVQDVMDDSNSWRKEQRSRAWKKDSYMYTESNTAKERMRMGPAEGRPNTTTQRASRAADTNTQPSQSTQQSVSSRLVGNTRPVANTSSRHDSNKEPVKIQPSTRERLPSNSPSRQDPSFASRMRPAAAGRAEDEPQETGRPRIKSRHDSNTNDPPPTYSATSRLPVPRDRDSSPDPDLPHPDSFRSYNLEADMKVLSFKDDDPERYMRQGNDTTRYEPPSRHSGRDSKSNIPAPQRDKPAAGRKDSRRN